MIDKNKKKRRGRPRKFDPAKGLELAGELFHEKGYECVGITELCSALNIKPPSLYAAYGSKEELFRKAVEVYTKKMGEFIPSTLDAHQDVLNGVRALFQNACDEYVRHGEKRGCLLLEGGKGCGESSIKEFLRSRQKETKQLLVSRFEVEYPKKAQELAEYTCFVLAGLSSSASNGVQAEELRRVAEIAFAGFVERVRSSPN